MLYLSLMAGRQGDIFLPLRLTVSWWHCHVSLQAKWSTSISGILDMGPIQ